MLFFPLNLISLHGFTVPCNNQLWLFSLITCVIQTQLKQLQLLLQLVLVVSSRKTIKTNWLLTLQSCSYYPEKVRRLKKQTADVLSFWLCCLKTLRVKWFKNKTWAELNFLLKKKTTFILPEPEKKKPSLQWHQADVGPTTRAVDALI